MMRWWLPVLLFCACAQETGAPDDLLSREKFEAVLADAYLVEARLNHDLIAANTGQVHANAYYQEMFDRQGVTAETFRATYSYWAARQDEFARIVANVQVELARRKDAEVAP
jgi:Domain of unknown function (DUF4296)